MFCSSLMILVRRNPRVQVRLFTMLEQRFTLVNSVFLLFSGKIQTLTYAVKQVPFLEPPVHTSLGNLTT